AMAQTATRKAHRNREYCECSAFLAASAPAEVCPAVHLGTSPGLRQGRNPGKAFLVADVFAPAQPTTTRVFRAVTLDRTDLSILRCARTSSYGVNANHCASETSA